MEVKLQILESTDLTKVRKCQGSKKAKITSAYNILKPLLIKPKGVRLDLDEIDDDLVNENMAKLGQAWTELSVINDHILELVEDKDDETETAHNYLSQVSKVVSEIRGAVKKYTKIKELATKTPSLICKIEQKKSELSCIDMSGSSHWANKTKNLGKDALKEIDVLFDYRKEIKRVEHTYNELSDLITTLKELYMSAGLEAKHVIDDIGFDLDEITVQKFIYLQELERVHLAHGQPEPVSKSDPSLETSVSVVPATTPSVKIKAREAPKFSGKAEEFAAFQKEFKALVVPGRCDADIAATLKDSTPRKHQHLFVNCAATDWVEMLEIMQKELAPTRDIVNNVRATIKKIRPIDKDDKKADQKLVEMVDTMLKIKRDLTEVNKLSIISNPSVIGEIELKLPFKVREKWGDVKIEKSLGEADDSVIFPEFIKYLETARYKYKEYVSEADIAIAEKKPFTAYCTGRTFTLTEMGVKNSADKTKLNPKSKGGQLVKTKAGNVVFCLACGKGGKRDASTNHHTHECDVWKNMSTADREKCVSCVSHPYQKHKTVNCNYRQPCTQPNCNENHHWLMCTSFKVSGNVAQAFIAANNNCDDQSSSVHVPTSVPNERSVNSLSLSLQQLKDSMQTDIVLLPTLNILVGDFALRKVGTLLDCGSTDDYILNEVAQELDLPRIPCRLQTHGISGQVTVSDSFLYKLSVYDESSVEI